MYHHRLIHHRRDLVEFWAPSVCISVAWYTACTCASNAVNWKVIVWVQVQLWLGLLCVLGFLAERALFSGSMRLHPRDKSCKKLVKGHERNEQRRSVQSLNLSLGVPRWQLAEAKYYNLWSFFLQSLVWMFDGRPLRCQTVRQMTLLVLGDLRKSPLVKQITKWFLRNQTPNRSLDCKLRWTLTAYFDFEFSGSLVLRVTS